MYRPLSLVNSTQQGQQQIQRSPYLRQRADSLVFSITSQKNHSPRQTLLMQSQKEEMSKDIQTLQLKLDYLENKFHSIPTQNICLKHHDQIDQNKQCQINIQEYYGNKTTDGRQAYNQQINAGKIIKKNYESKNKHSQLTKKSPANKHKTIKTHDSTLVYHSRNSLVFEGTGRNQKSKQIHKLRRQLSLIRQSVQKTQRSKSLCSQRLSATKYEVKQLKKKSKQNEKSIVRLERELKKSENIREKQKSLILKQQQQINLLKRLLVQKQHSLRS